MKLTTIGLGWTALAGLLVGGAGCGQRDRDRAQVDPPAKVGAKRPVATAPDRPVTVAPKTGEERGAAYLRCRGHFNARQWGALNRCYAPDVESDPMRHGMPVLTGAAAVVASARQFATAFPDVAAEPQLILISGHTIQSVTLLRGTHQGSLALPTGELPPTDRTIGLLMAHGIVVDDDAGQATREWTVYDGATMLGQLGQRPAGMLFRPAIEQGRPGTEVVIARDDATEERNLDSYQSVIDAFNRHDARALGRWIGDDAVWTDPAMPKELTRGEMMALFSALWAAFSDLRAEPNRTWTAGDHVVSTGTMTGTNDGAARRLGLARTGRKLSLPYLEIIRFDQGRVSEGWRFYDRLTLAAQLGPPDGQPGQ